MTNKKEEILAEVNTPEFYNKSFIFASMWLFIGVIALGATLLYKWNSFEARMYEAYDTKRTVTRFLSDGETFVETLRPKGRYSCSYGKVKDDEDRYIQMVEGFDVACAEKGKIYRYDNQDYSSSGMVIIGDGDETRPTKGGGGIIGRWHSDETGPDKKKKAAKPSEIVSDYCTTDTFGKGYCVDKNGEITHRGF